MSEGTRRRSGRFAATAARLAAKAVLFLYAAWFTLEMCRPDLLIVGNITVDLVDGTTPTGGAVSYASVVAQALGATACIITVAGPEADLDVFGDAELYIVPANNTLTFEHSYAWWGHSRRLRVTANPNITLSRAHVPWRCRFARVVLLGPLTLHDVDAASFARPQGFWEQLLNRRQLVGLMAQGFQRALGKDGEVLPLPGPSPQLLGGLSKRVHLFLSDVETDTWSQQDLSRVVSSAASVIVTEGDKGATLLVPTEGRDSSSASSASNSDPSSVDSSSTTRSGGPFSSNTVSSSSSSGGIGFEQVKIPAVKVPQAVDTNGAGDTFATMYMLAMMRGDAAPGSTASWAASRAVLQPQTCKPRCTPALITASATKATQAGASSSSAAGLDGRGRSSGSGGGIPPLGQLERAWMAAIPLLQHGASVLADLLRQVLALVPSSLAHVQPAWLEAAVQQVEQFAVSSSWGISNWVPYLVGV